MKLHTNPIIAKSQTKKVKEAYATMLADGMFNKRIDTGVADISILIEGQTVNIFQYGLFGCAKGMLENIDIFSIELN
jgi:hypothetical protein